MQLLKRRTKKGEGFDAVESDREFWYSATVAVVAGCDFDDEGGDGVDAVAGLVAEGVEVALGVAAAADILNDDVKAVAREPYGMRVDDSRCDVSAVGLAHQQCRLGSGLRRVVVVGDESDAIGHAAGEGTFETDAGAAVDEGGHC